MRIPQLVVRNLVHHWRGNLPVLLGVAVGSAVLTGALLVGDSLRGSLRAKAERQLGGVDSAAMFLRPVRAEIADGLPGSVAPVLLLPGSIQTVPTGDAAPTAIGRVTILGIDDRFKPAGLSTPVDWNGPRLGGGKDPVVLSARVAERLGVKAGDRVRLGVERFSDLPRSSTMAKRGVSDVTATITGTVAAVLPPDSPANDFNLTPNPAAPLNVFVPLRPLSELVVDDPNRDRDASPKVTALLASGTTTAALNDALRSRLSLDDYGLRVRVPPKRKAYVSVEAEQMIFDPAMATAIERAAAEVGVRAERTIIYVADAISHGTAEIPYSIIAALNPSAAAPLGPFLPPGVSELKDGEVVLADWKDSPLRGLPPGTELKLTYYNPEVEGDGRLETATLTLRGYVPLAGVADDRDLTPPVKGMTDERANVRDWNRPPMLDNAKVQQKIKAGDIHDRFWNTFKATPKAYVNLATGQKLFGSRYGSVTSIRVAPNAGETPEAAAERLKPAILKYLNPASAGLAFEPIRERLFTASRGGTDFGGLFLGFSLFLIAAALMLVGLLFRLALDRRAKEIGLLLAAGFTVKQVRRLVLAEGLLVAVVGAAIGLVVAFWYNRLLLRVLLDLWPDPEVATFLKPHATPLSFGIGFFLSVLMALGALWLSVRGLVKVPPPALLRGETSVPQFAGSDGLLRWVRLLIPAALIVGVLSLVGGRFVANPDFRAMTFFAGGGLLLTAGLATVWMWMKRARHAAVTGRGAGAIGRLGARNAARNPSRSLLTAALLAAAAFLLVAVESFRRQPEQDFLDKTGGSGGFNLVAETDVPIFQPLDKPAGRAEIQLGLESAYGGLSDTPKVAAALAELDGVEVFPLRLRGGDDASCLNLFQAARPRVLGVPDALIDRGGFKFYQTQAATPEEQANPWLLLRRPQPNGAIPVFVENNTAVWMLKTGVGGEVTMPGDDGTEITFRIVGTLVDSPFQSELITADSHFTAAFPKQDGYRVFLARTPAGKEQAVARVLETGLRANGLIATPTRDRVAAYQSVVGAYLSTFQLLGGFGLLLGVLGLAVVILRAVWERVGELALLRAVGYRPRTLQFLVLAENALLLALGLGLGVLAALASVAPHVLDGASVPWVRLAGIFALVAAVGLLVASFATAGILRVPMIPALRRE